MNLLARLYGLPCLGLLVCALISTSQAHPQPSLDAVAFKQALGDYKAGHRTAAYGQFARLADHGDAESARIALILLRYGEQMGGAGWGASQQQIDRWMALARQPMTPLTAEAGD